MISFAKEKYNAFHFLLYGGVLGVFHWLIVHLFHIEFSHLNIVVIYGGLVFIHLLAYFGGRIFQLLFPEFSAQLLLVALTVKMLVSLLFLLLVIYPIGPHSKPFALHFMVAYLFMLGIITYKFVKMIMKDDK